MQSKDPNERALADALQSWRFVMDRRGWLPDETWAYSLACVRHHMIQLGDPAAFRSLAEITRDITRDRP